MSLRKALLLGALAASSGCAPRAAEPRLVLEPDLIEACSCPLFCQCFLGRRPAEHGGSCYCRFNTAFRIVRGRWGEVPLDGVGFWVGGDLGECLLPERDWAVLVFDRGSTPAQREGVRAFVRLLYPFPWKSMAETEAEISWRSAEDGAEALLDGGLTGGIRLSPLGAAKDPGRPVVLDNLPYMRTQENDGFRLMPCLKAWFKPGNSPFDISECNGFRIRVRMDTGRPLPEYAAGM